MSLKQNNQNGIPLVGGALAVLIALPIAAFLGSFGSTYESRSLIYILILGWTVVGAITLGLISSRGSKGKQLTIKHLLLWIVSVWVWPLLVLTLLARKKH